MFKKWKAGLLATALISALTFPAGAGQAVADAPASQGYTLVYEDEFAGTSVNESDWMYRDAGPYAQGYNKKENVRVSDGLLHIDFKREQIGGTWYNTCGGIVTKKLFGYGYYETRAKLFKATTGLHSSFWSMGLSNHIQYDNVTGLGAEIAAGNLPYYNQVAEIDGFEYDSGNSYFDTGTVIHVNGYSNKRQHVTTNADDWHVYGYEWAPTFIKYYLDGAVVHTINFGTNPTPYAPANFWFTALGYSAVGDYSKLPGESQFDYFRYYAKSYPGANLLGNGAMEYTPKDTSKGYTDQDTPAWIEYYDKTAGFMTTSDSHSGTRSLKHSSAVSYQITTKQNLNGIANGAYDLTAWVKSSGGQSQARMRVLNFGGSEIYVDVPTTSTWTQVTIPNVNVTNHQATIAFTSIAGGGQWMLVDDVSFAQPMPATAIYENESLPVTVSGTTTTNYNDAPASGGTFSNVNATAVNQYAEYTVNLTQPGTYTVYVGNRIALNKGIYQLYVDGSALGSPVDQYSSASGYNEVNLGNVAFGSSGNKSFRFQVTGKNAASSGYQLGLDYIKLVRN